MIRGWLEQSAPGEPPVRKLTFNENDDVHDLLSREWLTTNGLGGYASGTVLNVATRRYHGLLVAALPAPLGRTMLFNHLVEEATLDGRQIRFGGEELRDVPNDFHVSQFIEEFRIERAAPSWTFKVGEARFEKLIHLPQHQNTVHIRYRLLSGPERLTLSLQPYFHFRGHDVPVGTVPPDQYQFHLSSSDHYELLGPEPYPPLRISFEGLDASCRMAPTIVSDVFYRIEDSRGYENTGQLWSPGSFEVTLTQGSTLR